MKNPPSFPLDEMERGREGGYVDKQWMLGPCDGRKADAVGVDVFIVVKMEEVEEEEEEVEDDGNGGSSIAVKKEKMKVRNM
jgi:hypothetical protein